MFTAAAAYLYVLYQDLPEIDASSVAAQSAETSIVYAADGSVLAEWHGEEDRKIVSMEEIPDVLRYAVVAVEDQRFFEHHGVDITALLRAVKTDVEEGGYAQGGSTITQQLVKLMCEDDERTLSRKIREALMAFQVEAETDKDKVLEAYLNLVYFGHGRYGVESASRYYFGKSVSDLDLPEAAVLAGVIRSPGNYSPATEPESAKARRDLVISIMEEQDYVSVSDAREARATEIELAPPEDVPSVAPHFVEFVKQQLIDELGVDAVFSGGLQVYTTLDPLLQEGAVTAAASVLPYSDDPEVGLVCLEHQTGRVRAMVGGRDFSVSQFNLAVQSHRQPGSAFKPFVLAAALDAGIDPETIYETSPYTVEIEDGTWSVDNYEGGFPEGVLTLRDATVWSVNAVYARLVIQIGADAVVEMAHAMGITSALEPNPAIALGGLTEGVSPLEMASAYGSIASGGNKTSPSAILRVTGSDGETLLEPSPISTRAIPEETAVEMSMILHEVIERGTGAGADIGTWAAGKTGTTQSYRDAWFVGYCEDLVTSVWVGYAEGQVEMEDVHGIRVSGGTFPAQIWREFMSRAILDAQPVGTVVEPLPGESYESETVEVRICRESFKLATPACPDVVRMYLPANKVPEDTCDLH